MSTKNSRLLLGAHMSISDGLEKAIKSGASIGCTTIQIFTKSNRQWNAKIITPEEIEHFKAAAKTLKMGPIIAHATYLINIASADPKVSNASTAALAMELARCQSLDIPYLVLHPGSYGKGTPQEGLERISHHLDAIFEKVPGHTMILLETMAGQGTALCWSFEQIAQVINKSTHKKRLGVCFDTCHAFVAGYDFKDSASYHAMWENFDKTIGIERLKAIHVNDSKKGLGSRVDRHEHIGKGALGLEPFSLLFNDPRFFDIPKILETPKATEEPFTEDKMNMATIHSLLTPKTRKLLNREE
ncbi:deoxyribonuclease IV [soil metagenome]